MISQEETKHIAALARIALSKQEEEKFQKDLSLILDFVKKIEEVDISGVEPTFYPISLQNVFRVDEVKSSNPALTNKLKKLMPAQKDEFLKVKSVFD